MRGSVRRLNASVEDQRLDIVRAKPARRAFISQGRVPPAGFCEPVPLTLVVCALNCITMAVLPQKLATRGQLMNRAAFPVEGEPYSVELTPPEQPWSFELASPAQPLSVELTQLDRREKPREVIRVQARISPEGDEPLDAHTVDLSSHGLAITSARPLNVEQVCNVELGISVPELARPPSLRASVRYCARLRDGQFRIGMKFTTVSIEAAELIVAALGL